MRLRSVCLLIVCWLFGDCLTINPSDTVHYKLSKGCAHYLDTSRQRAKPLSEQRLSALPSKSRRVVECCERPSRAGSCHPARSLPRIRAAVSPILEPPAGLP